MSRAFTFVLTAALAASCFSGGARAGASVPPQRAPARQAQEAPRQSLAVIVNRTNPVENLSFAELRQYFLGERARWSNGRRVQIVMREAGQPERDAVLRLIYEMREQDFQAHFLRARFTGETLEEPRRLDTAARVVNFVFLQPGAVGYVSAGEIAPSVKVVRIDGLLPGEANYRLTF